MKKPSSTSLFSRRQFIYTTSAAAAAAAFSSQNILGANERVRIAMIGSGLRSRTLVERFLNVPDVDIVALCDPDTAQMDKGIANIEKLKNSATEAGQPFPDVRPERIQDYRKLYERNDIDAVVIASPNYWHTLHAIQALQSGKHVYVEKPATFSHWEGMQLEAAAARYGKVIAVGYQNRSDPGPQAGIRYVQEGSLGKILKVRVLCFRNRKSIGKVDRPITPPSTMDYDLWLGPSQDQPILRPEIHYDWHWDFNTGNGDMGNQSVHEIDMAYWLLGHPGLPGEVRSFGNRFAWNDAGNTPNMQAVWCKWGGAEVILETNDLNVSPERNVSHRRMGTSVGIIAECEKGFLKGGRGGMVALEPDGRTIIQKFPGNGGKSHFPSFINAVRSNDPSDFPITVAQAHVSESVMHLGNASYRLGKLTGMSEIKRLVSKNGDLTEILSDQNKQLEAWGVKDPQYYWGRKIRLDPESQNVKTWWVPKELTGPHYRKGYEVPELV